MQDGHLQVDWPGNSVQLVVEDDHELATPNQFIRLQFAETTGPSPHFEIQSGRVRGIRFVRQ